MTPWEFALAFPYCTPGIGDIVFDQVYGRDSMHRFVYHTTDSFFHAGRVRRDTLVKEHGRLDPLIGGIIREEVRANWWRHLLVSVPLAWCGMWVGWLWALLTIPLFAYACAAPSLTLPRFPRPFPPPRAGEDQGGGRGRERRWQPLLLLYAAPAVVMLGLHAAVANHYTRYNLILIGPLAAGAASVISAWLAGGHWRSQARAPES